jgi:hypothetical protein
MDECSKKKFISHRATVTTGMANEVEDLNQIRILIESSRAMHVRFKEQGPRPCWRLSTKAE